MFPAWSSLSYRVSLELSLDRLNHSGAYSRVEAIGLRLITSSFSLLLLSTSLASRSTWTPRHGSLLSGPGAVSARDFGDKQFRPPFKRSTHINRIYTLTIAFDYKLKCVVFSVVPHLGQLLSRMSAASTSLTLAMRTSSALHATLRQWSQTLAARSRTTMAASPCSFSLNLAAFIAKRITSSSTAAC